MRKEGGGTTPQFETTKSKYKQKIKGGGGTQAIKFTPLPHSESLNDVLYLLLISLTADMVQLRQTGMKSKTNGFSHSKHVGLTLVRNQPPIIKYTT